MTGLLYLTGAVSAVVLLLLPGAPISHPEDVLATAGLGALWGGAALWLVRWTTAPRWLTHVSTSAGFLVAGVVMAATGGASSPGRFFLFFIAVFAAYFYSPRQAALYLGGCAVASMLPLAYDSGAIDGGYLRELVVVIPTYFVLGGAIAIGTVRLTAMRDRAQHISTQQRRLADEQEALRHVATAVAAERPPEEIYTLVSEELAELVGAAGAGVLRYQSEQEMVVIGSWATRAEGQYVPGTIVPILPGTDIEAVRSTRRPVRIDQHEPGSPSDQLGYAGSILAPIMVDADVWGLLAIASVEPAFFAPDTELRLSAFADLLAMAVANTEHRATLAAQAATDPLTGLANHRAFHERLGEEVARARRHRRELALALFDVDHFKQINDSAGHGAGDQVLAEIATRVRAVSREEDVLARLGGDEFAVLMPETTRDDALALAERARQLISREPIHGHHVTVSIGVCDLGHAGSADALVRLADGALYWGKAHGRDVTWLYDPNVVQELSAHERAEHLQRSQVMVAVRALARAIDAKDPTTRLHSERVATLAAHLGDALGWPAERLHRLREAALIHDVGKLGVPDAVLLKPGRLNEAEHALVRQHAALGAQIAEEVLTPEQVEWVRWHHERPDGGGYPDGLTAAEIPEGAALLALADAFDVMTVSRPYGAPKPVDVAIAECRSLVGRQFTEESIAALTSLSEGSLLAVAQPA